MSSEHQKRERCGLKGGWQTVPDVWTSDRKTPHPQCCRHPWHEQCPGVSRPEMSLAGDSRNCMTVIEQMSMSGCHRDNVANPDSKIWP